jgi:hypothetical protein
VFMRFLFCDIIDLFHFLRFYRPHVHVWLIDRNKYLSAFAKTTSTLDDRKLIVFLTLDRRSDVKVDKARFSWSYWVTVLEDN